MDNLKKFFLFQFNALSKPKIINISGLETHLNLPDKLIYNWLKGVKYRDLGDFETVVENWAKTVGYKEDGIYDPIISDS